MNKFLYGFFLFGSSVFVDVKCFLPQVKRSKTNIHSLTSLNIFKSQSKSSSSAYPKYDKETQKWLITSPEQAEGYGPSGSLLRQGPLPFFRRIFSPSDYEQAVLKYMATEKCDRLEAQGNMDAYFENPSDWTYQKLQERSGKLSKRDYVTIDKKRVVLTLTWAVLVTTVLGQIVHEMATTNYSV
uniref:Uncharacterized protein n=1 Tax=Corethron hystrix TaxID=216773 RepID=A0A7S1BHD8_9STRA|mmetsp:Transcript_28294/g.64722  ORF Transcript_28294/g.64722 Transcript_28294/m.64722 type:complete len:184 (+) Transcript_28294:42-593(+)|eukprot:CAMPEP_0113302346 /NCGR_PEP_ID=MMETSP0010_2-20120614/3191_1 /TAXON_ID=216773 ORGANISM="Corethron hystrix, Strain 308" /NCGR_SAMPLE_ID=MMETSP0010_2 /ASSEMBLY_ACC=CAM_ASM_000155 /LENGTH=183 /DNA_ID=CAMNT_0000156109 /DNA_START=34 /DNA_END=585 /DNA_ORIENTATION=- /assembly_acc=CAM_ASM_000155